MDKRQRQLDHEKAREVAYQREWARVIDFLRGGPSVKTSRPPKRTPPPPKEE